MKLGLISDTHNHFDPRVVEIFKGVDHILHAGDIGRPWLIMELEKIAPTTVVIGNTDSLMSVRETEIETLGGKKFLVTHIVNPQALTPSQMEQIQSEKPDVVMFGHTHKPFWKQVGNLHFLNPGYAGQSRFGMERSVAVMEIAEDKMTVKFVPLA
jgi:putative phosphoesterase